MRQTPHDHGLNLLGDSAGRSSGLHMSDIYGDLCTRLEPKRYSSVGGPNVVKMAMGLAWEDFVERRLLQSGVNAARPGEFMTAEGIAYSPDLLITNGATRLGEIKLTYMSETESLADPKFSKWLMQAKAYCHHLEIPTARFYVLFVNGNYRTSRDPVFRAYDLEFTAQDLRENWDMLRTHGRTMGVLP